MDSIFNVSKSEISAIEFYSYNARVTIVHVPNREKAAQPQPEAYPEIEILCLSLAPTKFLLNSCPVS